MINLKPTLGNYFKTPKTVNAAHINSISHEVVIQISYTVYSKEIRILGRGYQRFDTVEYGTLVSFLCVSKD